MSGPLDPSSGDAADAHVPAGPLAGYRVVEIAGTRSAFAGKLLADMGADVVVVEPPGGCETRRYEPFVEGAQGDVEQSLYWWHYNTSKRSVVVDLATPDGAAAFGRLAAWADVAIEGQPVGQLDALGLDWAQLGDDGAPRAASSPDDLPRPGLIWVSITHNGRDQPDPPSTDLTLLAEGGPIHSCGYDDHSLPPVRGLANQAMHIACEYAVASLLAALYWREETAHGQLIDVSMLAAANLTTEMATHWWLNQGIDVQRQTGRHALPTVTDPTQVRCADGRWLNTGVPPRRGAEFAVLSAWVRELGLADVCPYVELLAEGERFELIDILNLDADPLGAEVFGAGRDTIRFLAERMGAHELFVGLQLRGLACGVVYSPDEMLADEHFVARGWPTEVRHEGDGGAGSADDEEGDGGASFTGDVVYPGPPYRFSATPWSVRRAPRIGEHQAWLEALTG